MGEVSELVSDDDRDRTVELLRDSLLSGRLTLEEFAERVGLALEARSRLDLDRAAERLPANVAPPATRRRAVRITLALFGRVVRRGRLRIGRRTLVLAGFADVDLDLREAEIGEIGRAHV